MSSHTLPKHNYATRANLVPQMSPITPPIRPRPSPPAYDHPYSLGMERGREDEIEELNLGEPRIPLDDDTTHVVVRRGGETVVFGWEERLRVANTRERRDRNGEGEGAVGEEEAEGEGEEREGEGEEGEGEVGGRWRVWKRGPGRN